MATSHPELFALRRTTLAPKEEGDAYDCRSHEAAERHESDNKKKHPERHHRREKKRETHGFASCLPLCTASMASCEHATCCATPVDAERRRKRANPIDLQTHLRQNPLRYRHVASHDLPERVGAVAPDGEAEDNHVNGMNASKQANKDTQISRPYAQQDSQDDFRSSGYPQEAAHARAYREEPPRGHKLNNAEKNGAQAEYPPNECNAQHREKEQHHPENHEHDGKEEAPAALFEKRIAGTKVGHQIDNARNDNQHGRQDVQPHENLKRAENADQTENKEQHARKQLHPVH